jgi:hypothetical protein
LVCPGRFAEDIFGKMKPEKSTLPQPLADWPADREQGFTLHAHRLPSLLRNQNLSQTL